MLFDYLGAFTLDSQVSLRSFAAKIGTGANSSIFLFVFIQLGGQYWARVVLRFVLIGATGLIRIYRWEWAFQWFWWSKSINVLWFSLLLVQYTNNIILFIFIIIFDVYYILVHVLKHLSISWTIYLVKLLRWFWKGRIGQNDFSISLCSLYHAIRLILFDTWAICAGINMRIYLVDILNPIKRLLGLPTQVQSTCRVNFFETVWIHSAKILRTQATFNRPLERYQGCGHCIGVWKLLNS